MMMFMRMRKGEKGENSLFVYIIISGLSLLDIDDAADGARDTS